MFSLKNCLLFVYKEPVSMLTSFDGLSGLITNCIKQNPLDGDAFIFINERRTRMKILRWEHDGFMMIYKQLERGTFKNPASTLDVEYLQISHDNLVDIITGKGGRKTRKRACISQQ